MMTESPTPWQGAPWITAPDHYLATLESFPEPRLKLGRYLWIAHNVRSHIRHSFSVEGCVSTAELEFHRDFPFDFYLNGESLPVTRQGDFWILDVRDATRFIRTGTNHVAIRGYQSCVPYRFSSALRGAIQITLSDGSTRQILTDESWQAFDLRDSGEKDGPEGWQTANRPGTPAHLTAHDIHPRLLRRSCYFRREFDITRPITRASLRSTAWGFYELHINGRPVSTDLFTPGPVCTHQEHQEYDATSLLTPGTNVIGAITGNGWFNGYSGSSLQTGKLELCVELRITYADGTQETLTTDPQWRVCRSPILEDDLMFGERYDARLEITGWDRTGLEPHGWVPVDLSTAPGHACPMGMQEGDPIRVTQTLSPIDHRLLADGSPCFDFGQNAAGRISLRVRNATPGTIISVHYCERLDTRGEPILGLYSDLHHPADTAPAGKAPYGARNIDTYICRGGPEELLRPRFCYTGFRYAWVTGYPGSVAPGDIEFRIIHSDLPVAGTFECGHELLTRLWHALRWSYRSNILGGPIDCPTREKNYWTGDIQCFADTACWYMDNSRFLSAWTRFGMKCGGPTYGWEDELYIVPWTLYRFYGDRALLAARYPRLLEQVALRTAEAGDILPQKSSSGYEWADHLAAANVPADFFAGCYFCLMLKRAALIAAVLGHRKDAADLQGRFETAREAFLSRFYRKDAADFTPQCQGGLIFPLAFDLVPESDRPRIGDRLASQVVADGYHPTTGFMSTPFLLPLLCDYGHADVALKLLQQTTRPSWTEMLANGATTLTEGWPSLGTEPGGGSTNHYALGSIGRWFFEYLGGIRLDPDVPAFSRFLLRPVFIRELGPVRASYRCPYGEIVSAWHVGAAGLHWEFTIPAGTTARVIRPDGQPADYPAGSYNMDYPA